MRSTLESNLADVRSRIAEAAARGGRDPADVALVAVTKSVGPSAAEALVRLGQADLGESRAGELVRKAAWLERRGLRPRWHFVGHLQRNKARRVVELADAIHSVDSPRLLETLDRLAGEVGRSPELYLQVKLAPEPGKSGLDPAALASVVEVALDLRHARLAGLMTMAPLDGGSGGLAGARSVFQELASLARGLAREPRLREAFRFGRVRTSMGMSEDFEAAIEEGSDVVRVGARLFEGVPAEAGGDAGIP